MILSPNSRLIGGATGIVWDDPPCPLCAGERRSPVIEAPDRMPGGSGLRFAVVRCDECGLHFTSPRPDRTTIGQFYRPGTQMARVPEFREGSATLTDVLEHVHDPLNLLNEVRQRLGGGRLTVSVPNIDCKSFRRFGAAWVGLDLPRHLTHFTPATLWRILERAGFRVTSLRTIPRPAWATSSAGVAIRGGRATPRQRALAWKPLATLAAVTSCIVGGGDAIVAVADVPPMMTV
jgi:hypothetical protein